MVGIDQHKYKQDMNTHTSHQSSDETRSEIQLVVCVKQNDVYSGSGERV
jgi:V8-like Glu-specific endopeptidase